MPTGWLTLNLGLLALVLSVALRRAVSERRIAERMLEELARDQLLTPRLEDLLDAINSVISDLHDANQLGPCGESREAAIVDAITALREATLDARSSSASSSTSTDNPGIV